MREIAVVPYLAAAGLQFGWHPREVESRLGEPPRQGLNNIELLEWDYGELVVRFDRVPALVEATVAADVLLLGGGVQPAVAVARRELGDFLRSRDAGCFVWSRFLVSPAWGLALDPAEPPWVTCFAAGELAQWRLGRLRALAAEGH